jgi:hypothetical protein
MAVGAGAPVKAPIDVSAGNVLNGKVGPISVGSIPIALLASSVFAFEMNVEVTCERTDQAFLQWQSDTYDAITAAYAAMIQANTDEKAGLAVQQRSPVDANSPDQNAITIKQEMKRQVIEMLIGTPFLGLDAVNWDPNSANPPSNNLQAAARSAPEIQFLEQAFEWETLSYICYPYYWGASTRWPALAAIEGNDANFADFLRSGSARVIVPARPGFEDQVNFYVKFGILWGGGPMPAPGDPDYLSIADEIKDMQQRPLDVTVADTWQVRLPTTLIWLESPAAGDAVTITGTNFGDIAAGGGVTFNGTAARATVWSSHLIQVRWRSPHPLRSRAPVFKAQSRILSRN